MSEPFRYLLRVRYGECDAQHVVFNARYGDFVDIAINELVRAMWGDYDSLLAQDLDMQVVHFSIDWSGPARFDEVLAVDLRCAQVGRTSFSFEADFSVPAVERAVARAKIVYVMFRPSSGDKCEIPAHLRKQLEAGAPGVVVNHAGGHA